MAKLKFTFGAMGAGKSFLLCLDYLNSQKNSCLVVSSVNGLIDKVSSRSGISLKHHFAIGLDDTKEKIKEKIEKSKKERKIENRIKNLFIDEAQFLNPQVCAYLREISNDMDINIFFYGLKIDFMGNLFPASKKIFEITDEIKSINSICNNCKKFPASYNLRFVNNSAVFHGDVISTTDKENYDSRCYACKEELFAEYQENLGKNN